MIKFRIIETYEQFKALASSWNELLSGNPIEDTFMTHEWFDCWIRSRQEPLTLCLVTGWRDGQLVSIAPLQKKQVRLKSLPIKALKFLQSPISPRCNFIAASDDELETLLENIRQLHGWDILIAENMEEAQPVTRAFLNYLGKNNVPCNIAEGLMTPYLDVTGTWDDYLASLSSNRRKFLRGRCLSRMEKAEQHSIECITTAAEFERIYPIMLDISAKSWKGAGGTAIGQVEAAYDFYRYFTPIALENGWAEIWLLMVNNKYAAFEYYFRSKNMIIGSRTEFDEEFGYYHPGENLKIANLKGLFARGRRFQLDFGGDSMPYKLKWTSSIKRHLTITVSRGTLLGKATILWKNTLVPLISRMKGPQDHKSLQGIMGTPEVPLDEESQTQ